MQGPASNANPQPAITTLSPPSATVESGPLTLAINGSGFINASMVTFNRVPHTPSFVNNSQLTITLSASDLSLAGAFPLVVTNPAPGGGASNSINFTVGQSTSSAVTCGKASPAGATVSLIPTSSPATAPLGPWTTQQPVSNLGLGDLLVNGNLYNLNSNTSGEASMAYAGYPYPLTALINFECTGPGCSLPATPGVAGYPEMIYGHSPWSTQSAASSTQNPSLTFPLSVSSLASGLWATTDYSVSATSGTLPPLDFTYDIWITQTPQAATSCQQDRSNTNGQGDPTDYELMIWLDYDSSFALPWSYTTRNPVPQDEKPIPVSIPTWINGQLQSVSWNLYEGIIGNHQFPTLFAILASPQNAAYVGVNITGILGAFESSPFSISALSGDVIQDIELGSEFQGAVADYSFAVSAYCLSVGTSPASCPLPSNSGPSPVILVADANGQLWKTGATPSDATWIGGLPAVMPDIASYNGALYGVSAAPSGGFSTLYSVDPASGAGRTVGTGNGVVLNALAFNVAGTLYAAGGDHLYTLNTSTGVATLVGSGIGSGTYSSSGGLAFDSGGNLYLTSAGTQLYLLNSTTGQGTLIGNIGYSGVGGLAYLNGVMYGVTGSGQVISISLSSGAGTLVTKYNLQFYGATTITEAPTSPPQTLLTDTFSEDSTLNTSLWSTNTSFLKSLANNTSFLIGSTYEQAALAFTSTGMNMTGVSANYQFTGVQSNLSFTPPFSVQATVEGVVDYGIAFELYVVNGDLTQYVSLSANLAPNSGYYGMNFNTGCLCDDGFGGTTLWNGNVGIWYAVTISFDSNGYSEVTLTDIDGNRLNYTVPFYVGTGPFYVVLAQRQGTPNYNGPDSATWGSISITRPSRPPS
jgi:hypothetical protein